MLLPWGGIATNGVEKTYGRLSSIGVCMSVPTRRSLPALALLVVGVALLAAGLLLFPHAGDPAYVHSVAPIPESEVPEAANVTAYADLSPEGQTAFLETLDASDDTYIVRDEAEKPPEFFYSDHAELNRGIYVVQYQGAYYRLTTSAGGGLGFVAYGIKLLVGGLGVLLAAVGGLALVREDERTPRAVWAGLGAVTALFVVRGLAPSLVPAGLAQILPVALAVFVVTTYLAYRYAH